MSKRQDGAAGGPAFENPGSGGTTVSWDPYQVWLERVQQPREQRSFRSPQEPARRLGRRRSFAKAVSPSATP